METSHYNLKDGRLYPIVELESVLSHAVRRTVVAFITALLLLLTMVTMAGFAYTSFFVNPNDSIVAFVSGVMPRAVGALFILSGIWLFIFLLDAFFKSFYFKEKEIHFELSDEYDDPDLLSFHVMRILARTVNGDITKRFLESRQGKKIMLRCGISPAETAAYLQNRSTIPVLPNPPVVRGHLFTLKDLVIYLNSADGEFSNFIFAQGVTEAILMGATDWVVRSNEVEKQKERWWSRTQLDSLGGLGKDFAYGGAYKLEKYATEVHGSQGKNQYAFASIKNEEQLQQLKSILSRDKESNAVLVGERGGGKMSLIYALAQDVYNGAVPAQLEGKRVMLVDSDLIISGAGGKEQLESELLTVVDDAVRSGNILLIFNNFPEFILSARSANVNVMSILDPYFISDQIQIIVLADKEGFHQYLEQDSAFMQRFEKILIHQPEEDEAVGIIEMVAQELETNNNVLFTYESVIHAVRGAKSYFQDPIMPDKAIDLMVELPARLKQQGRVLVTKDDVLSLIQEKTHIPLGNIDAQERDKLTHLEKTLHDRVVGQEEAVNVVAKALRRSRSGVRNMKRPIGSFLFLGSTGVGKTETAKALSEVFFGEEDAMSRIDMSEYRGDDALDRLTGSFETGRVGLLVKILKEKPYGVILLDEFEKGSQKVHDLFLQVLDEGFFSDAWGKRVNARNVIFIATSNAGSQMIWEYLNKGIDMETAKKDIIDHVISEGLYRPEFLNRFDAVVLFHPLTKENIEKIAAIMLNNFKKRLRKKGLDLSITPALVKFVADQGFDPTFGARPMTRFIQEYVEQVVAEKMIRGEIMEGSHFELTPEDLQTLK